MSNRLRMVEPNVVYDVVINTIDRQFLFKPNSHPNDPLLHMDCQLDAFDPKNDLTPIPSILNIIGFALARAMELAPITLHYAEQNTTHLHLGTTADKNTIGNISRFFQIAKSIMAVQINALYNRTGTVFSGRYNTITCVDDESAEYRLLYAITNVVKDGLIENQNGREFLSAYPTLAKGEKLKFWKIDWATYWKKGGPRVKSHRLKDYIQWKELDFEFMAHFLNMTESQRQTRVRKQVNEKISNIKNTMKQEGKTVMGLRKLQV